MGRSCRFSHKLDSGKKSAKIKITQRSYLSTDITTIFLRKHQNIYEQKLQNLAKSGAVLDQEKLEDEVKRITELMQEKSYYIYSQ